MLCTVKYSVQCTFIHHLYFDVWGHWGGIPTESCCTEHCVDLQVDLLLFPNNLIICPFILFTFFVRHAHSKLNVIVNRRCIVTRAPVPYLRTVLVHLFVVSVVTYRIAMVCHLYENCFRVIATEFSDFSGLSRDYFEMIELRGPPGQSLLSYRSGVTGTVHTTGTPEYSPYAFHYLRTLSCRI